MPRTTIKGWRITEKERKKDNMEQKKHKENEIPGVIASQGSFQEPVKKRSKLVLPSPQIFESELKKVIKVEQDNEYAWQQTEEASKEDSASRGLLQEYSVTPGHMRTPWTLMTQDTILQGKERIKKITMKWKVLESKCFTLQEKQDTFIKAEQQLDAQKQQLKVQKEQLKVQKQKLKAQKEKVNAQKLELDTLRIEFNEYLGEVTQMNQESEALYACYIPFEKEPVAGDNDVV